MATQLDVKRISANAAPPERVRLTYKPHSVLVYHNTSEDHLSGTAIAGRLLLPTRSFNGTGRPWLLLGIAPGGVCLAADITADAGAPLPHPFTLTPCLT